MAPALSTAKADEPMERLLTDTKKWYRREKKRYSWLIFLCLSFIMGLKFRAF
jgi:hypothetical protein